MLDKSQNISIMHRRLKNIMEYQNNLKTLMNHKIAMKALSMIFKNLRQVNNKRKVNQYFKKNKWVISFNIINKMSKIFWLMIKFRNQNNRIKLINSKINLNKLKKVKSNPITLKINPLLLKRRKKYQNSPNQALLSKLKYKNLQKEKLI